MAFRSSSPAEPAGARRAVHGTLTWRCSVIVKACASDKLTPVDRSLVTGKVSDPENRAIVPIAPVARPAGRWGSTPWDPLRSRFRGSSRTLCRRAWRGSRRSHPDKQGSGTGSCHHDSRTGFSLSNPARPGQSFRCDARILQLSKPGFAPPIPRRRTFAAPILGSTHSMLTALRHPWLRWSATPAPGARVALRLRPPLPDQDHDEFLRAVGAEHEDPLDVAGAARARDE